jgi:hypothetical protein
MPSFPLLLLTPSITLRMHLLGNATILPQSPLLSLIRKLAISLYLKALFEFGSQQF